MAKPLSAWELKEQARRNAERRRRNIRRTGALTATVLVFSVAGLLGLKASHANVPVTVPAASVATASDSSQTNTPVAPALVSTPVTHDSNILSLTGTTTSPSLDSGDVSLAGTGVPLVPATPR